MPPKITNSDPQQEDKQQELTNRRLKQMDYRSRSVRELPPLIPGQRALYRDPLGMALAQVKGKHAKTMHQ